MATAITPRPGRPIWWWIHDVTVGLVSGFGVGTVAGLFLNRLVENNVVVLVCAILGATAGTYVLIQSHRESRRFLSGIVAVSWLLLLLSAAFLSLFIWAILNFE